MNQEGPHLPLTTGVGCEPQARESLGRETSCYSAQVAEVTSMTKGFSSGVSYFLATATEAGLLVGFFLVLPSSPLET